MEIRLHKNATTTPAQRAFIQSNPQLSVASLARRTGVSQTTIRRWKNRTDVFDRPHTPKRIETVLTPLDEVKIILCRMATRAGLDDLHQFIGTFMDVHCSRASLNRCLKRYHISRLPSLSTRLSIDLKDWAGTYFYYTRFELPPLSEKDAPISLHTVLDCSFRIFHARANVSGKEFLKDRIKNFPFRVLGLVYSDPITLARQDRAGLTTGHTKDINILCMEEKIKGHYLENSFSETMDKLGNTLEVILSSEGLNHWAIPGIGPDPISRDLSHYNTSMGLRALKQQTPCQAMQHHYTDFPGSFNANPATIGNWL